MSRPCALLISMLVFVAIPTIAQEGAAAVSGAGAGQAAEASEPITTIRTTARLVVLDVVVADGRGQPVKGLVASDFTLSEDGVPQRLASFVEHDARVGPVPWQDKPQEELPPNTFAVHSAVTGNGAMTAIVLGAMSFRDRVFVREQLKAYMKTASPETPIAIFSVDYQGTHLVQDFTTDRKVLQEAASSKRILPPLGFEPMGTVVSHGTLQLAQYLNQFPGRVNVIWFSSGGGGLPSVGRGGSDSAFADISSFVQNSSDPRSVLRLSRVAVYAVDASGACVADITAGVEVGCLPDIKIPDVDAPSITPTGGFVATVPDVPGARLAEMAEATGGRAVLYTNGFKQAIADIVTTGAHYYTVSYTPTNPNWDGSFRKIRLDVNTGDGPGRRLLDWLNNAIRVQYRRGYYARSAPLTPAPDTAASTAAGAPSVSQRRLISTSPKGDPGLGRGGQNDPMKRAMAFASATPVGLDFKITVTPSEEVDHAKAGAALPKDNYLTAAWKHTPYRNYRVRYSIAPEEMQLTARTGGGFHDMFQFVIVIYRDNGEPVNSIATLAPIDLSAADYARVMRNGLSFEQTVAIPTKINTNATPVTANFFLRAGVEEVETGRIGAIEVPAEWVKALPAEPGATAAQTAR
jgi:VWFA-related protein